MNSTWELFKALEIFYIIQVNGNLHFEGYSNVWNIVENSEKRRKIIVSKQNRCFKI